ncbi:MAG: sodium-dependent transporter [Betaproteobacteria bacterium]|nr:sodium-dependent transporter [Betaproteobacteria bacterium]
MGNNPQAPRSHWSSRWAFVVVTAGSAIGLGNIWKFPYMAGTNGGGAFVLVYLVCIALLGLPLMMTEIMLGRRAQRNPVDAMAWHAREAGASSWWRAVGVMGVLAGGLILSFYSVVAGWVLEYLARSLAGGFAGIDAAEAQARFDALLADPIRLIGWHSGFILMTAGVVALGVTSGLERANKILMPLLLLIVIILLGYGAAGGELGHAASYLFAADFSKITPAIVVAAMGQAFFTLSLGMGAVMAYGSYLERDVSILRTTLAVAAADTGIALLAGLAIFSIVFAHGLAPAAGPGLVMQTLPIAFGSMPGGALAGSLFFALLTFAAWTSSISLVEPAVSWICERTSFGRARASFVVGGAVWLLGCAAALSFNRWQEFRLFGLGLFDFLDYLTSNIMLPLGGLLMVVFAGWVMQRSSVSEELQLGDAGFRLWRIVARYVAPAAIILITMSLTGLLPF